MKRLFLLTFLAFSTAFSAFCSADKHQVTLMLQDSASGLTDQTVIYFQSGASVNYIFPEDNAKSFDTTTALPQLYSFSADNIFCYSNGYGDFTFSTIVGLGIRVPGGGTYKFSASQIFNFDPTSIILIEDRALGILTDLRAGDYSVAITPSGQINNRFFIHFSYPPIITVAPSGCNNNDGAVSVAEDSSITWSSCQLYNSSSALIGSFNNLRGDAIFTSLPAGSYNVQFTYGLYTASKTISVATNQVTASMNISTNHAAPGQEISFFSTGTNATQFEWDFGDGTIITGVQNPTYTYLQLGTYTPRVKYSNAAGCVAYADTTIVVSSTTSVNPLNANTVNIYPLHQSIRINVSNAGDNNFQYNVYNILGQTITTGPLISPDFTVNMSTRPDGVYIVTITNGNSKYSTKVFLNH